MTREAVGIGIGALFIAVLLFWGFFQALNGPNAGQRNEQTMNQAMNQSQSNLEIEDIVVGDGAEAEHGKQLTVHYTGALEDGTVFDSSSWRAI